MQSSSGIQHERIRLPGFFLVAGFLAAVIPGAWAQGVPTVQQSQFRSQWAGEQVDQIPLGGTITPMNSLGAIVGALQTPDEVQREVDASLSGVKQKSPFAFKPSLGAGWMVSNQGTQTTQNGQTTYGTGSSPFLSPAGAVLYDREHGPWALSAGYSVGYKYYTNPNFTANGTGSQRNPFSQTALLRSVLEMSRYVWSTLFTASYGNGYDLSSGSNNQQVNFNGNTEMKYLLSSSSAVAAKAGYNYQNSSGSSVTQNNSVSGYYANLSPIYEVSDKTHLSAIVGAGASYQSFNNTQTVPVTAVDETTGETVQTGTVSISSTPTSTLQFVQTLGKIKYDVTGKLAVEVSLGARQLSLNNSTNISTTTGSQSRSVNSNYNQNLGIKPAWTVGFNYTPTAKTSLVFSMGEQGSDIVPEINLLLNWNPREKTSVSLGFSQSENYSNIAASQYLISRGILGTINQRLFSNVTLMLSGGYTSQFYQNITGGSTPTKGAAAQIPGSYYLANVSLIWRIRDWVNLANTVYYNSGTTIQAGGNNSALSQTWYSISLNFAL